MATFVTPEDSGFSNYFELWKDDPMPMMTLTRTYSVSALQKRKERFNALLGWCIGKSASDIESFYLLPCREGFWQYTWLGINIMVRTDSGDLVSCDVPFSEDLNQFLADYDRLTGQCRETGEEYSLSEDYMIIGTSALIQTELDSVVNAMSPWFNPFFIWGKIRKNGTLPISFQFHMAHLDMAETAAFMNRLQETIDLLDPDFC